MNKQEAYDQMDAILRTARSADRGLTTSERTEFDRLEVVYRTGGAGAGIETRGVSSDGRSEADVNFSRYLRTGELRTSQGLSTAPDNGQTGSDNAGYMIPQGFWNQLTIALKMYGGIENDFRLVETDTGNPMPWPTVDPTAVVGTVVTSELNQASTISPYVFGQGMLGAWTVTNGGPILASVQLIQDSFFDVDEFVADRMGEAIGRELGALAISGTGSSQHLGVITALTAKGAWSAGSSGGFLNLTAATSVTTLGGSKTELAGNLLAPQTLLNMIAAVDPAYRDLPGTAFYVNDSQLSGLRTVVDSYGHPLLQDPSHESGLPTLWGYPVKVDQNIPNLTASTSGGPLFGNMSKAMVYRRAKDVTVMRLLER